MVDHSDKKNQIVQNVMSMILEVATSQVRVFVSYIPVYSFGKVFIMYCKHLSNELYVFLELYSSKYRMTIKLWTF